MSKINPSPLAFHKEQIEAQDCSMGALTRSLKESLMASPASMTAAVIAATPPVAINPVFAQDDSFEIH